MQLLVQELRNGILYGLMHEVLAERRPYASPEGRRTLAPLLWCIGGLIYRSAGTGREDLPGPGLMLHIRHRA